MRGGTALAQDPEEAMFASMPRSAIENVAVDYVLPLAGLAQTLSRLAGEPAPERKDAMPAEAESEMEIETEVAEFDMKAIETPREGEPSVYACPDCHGVLWEVEEGSLLRFRCRVGHAFSPETLLAVQSESLEEALWTALRALEESAALAGRLKDRAAERGHGLAAERFAEQARDAHGRAAIIRQALLGGQIIAENGPPGEEENARSLMSEMLTHDPKPGGTGTEAAA